ncbi:glutamine-hydrolyzing GMP synthase [bacterium]|nr:glutamine-hydrolyzing GMP synthase [bacterium]
MDTIAVLDFGGQYSHLIARRVRDLGVYAEVHLPGILIEELKNLPGLKGIILSGGAASVYNEDSPKCDKEILKLGIPILGICYGHQLIAYFEGGDIQASDSGEYGVTELSILSKCSLLEGLGSVEQVWMNHGDQVQGLPSGFSLLASSDNSPVAAFSHPGRKIYGVQFHPEVIHTRGGDRILKNFVINICKAQKEWGTDDIVNRIYEDIEASVAGRKCIIGLSGGVDSSTAAVLVGNKIGKDLVAVYVDTGLMRHRETEFMEEVFSKMDLDLRIIHARNRFFEALKGITEPEHKRKIIGKLFIDIFDEIAKQEQAEVLIQGTIYSDRIESGLTQHSDNIKSHHNVGGLPEDLPLEIYEPLRDLYKDEVRRIGEKIGLANNIVHRHVFPGPGLAIRIIGEVTPERADIVRRAGHIIEEELMSAGLYYKVWMGFAVLLPIKTVGIQGDSRSYKYPIVIRIIESRDAMTANFAKVPFELLERISTRITNQIREVNRVVYDISNKPPATMEWE